MPDFIDSMVIARDAAFAELKAASNKPLTDKQLAAYGAGFNAGYCAIAVEQAIQASNRAGRRIGAKEARAIHSLLKGR